MARRLTKMMRFRLKALVQKLVVPLPEEEAWNAELWNKLMTAISDYQLKRFPYHEMELLLKYKVADRFHHQTIRDPITRSHVQLNWSAPPLARGLLLPTTHRYNCSETEVVDADVWGLYRAHQEATKATAERLKARQLPYLNLINGARTMEQVVSVWSEAQPLAEEFAETGRELVVLTPADFDAIHRDQELRKAAEATPE